MQDRFLRWAGILCLAVGVAVLLGWERTIEDRKTRQTQAFCAALSSGMPVQDVLVEGRQQGFKVVEKQGHSLLYMWYALPGLCIIDHSGGQVIKAQYHRSP